MPDCITNETLNSTETSNPDSQNDPIGIHNKNKDKDTGITTSESDSDLKPEDKKTDSEKIGSDSQPKSNEQVKTANSEDLK